MVAYARASAAQGKIANPDNKRNTPIWVFAGNRDSVVLPLVLSKAKEFYEHFSEDVKYVTLDGAQHAFITDIPWSGANACGGLRTPFINNCNYDMAGEMFKHIYGNLNTKTTPKNQNIWEIDQSEYFPTGSNDRQVGMNQMAFVYVPDGCHSSPSACRTHVMYHGCNSGVSVVGDAIFKNAGFNNWAESNNIIVLYPQAFSSNCWDWNGAINRDTTYDTRDSPQMNVVNRMIEALPQLVAQGPRQVGDFAAPTNTTAARPPNDACY
jgi:hypothetical protein